MKNAVTKTVNIYTLSLMAVFPLFITNAYYNIQDDKLYYFNYSTAICAVLVTAEIIAMALSGKNGRKTYAASGSGKKRKKLAGTAAEPDSGNVTDAFGAFKAGIKENFGLPVLLMLILFTVIALSTVFSKWTYEAFWGNMGRFQGMYTWIFYALGFLMIALFYEPRHWHMDVMTAAGAIVCGWGILDYFYLSPIGWEENVVDYAMLDFASTMGNINLVTAAEGIYLLIASALFIGEEKRARSIFYFAAAAIAFMSLILCYSDNAMISAAAAFCFLPFYAFRSAKSLVRYLGLVTVYFLDMVIVGRITDTEVTSYADSVRLGHWGELLKMCNEHGSAILALFIISVAVCAAAYLLLRKTEKWPSGLLRKVWAALGAAAFIAVLALFIYANTNGLPEKYSEFSQYLVINDNWGTRRGYNWKLAFKYIKDFPLINILFGSGPETYSIYTLSYDYHNMIQATDTVFDSPHNEWLQYFFTIGILGFLSYYGMAASSMVSGFRAKADNDMRQMGTALSYGMFSNILVSFVNISTPVIGPILILSFAASAACGREVLSLKKLKRKAKADNQQTENQ